MHLRVQERAKSGESIHASSFGTSQQMGAQQGRRHRQSLAPQEELDQFLVGARSNPDMLKSPYASELLTHKIGAAILGLMMRPRDDLDVEAPLSPLELTLLGLELRNWMWRT